MKKLQDKVILVTGAGNGNGRGIALRLAMDGAVVIANDIDGKALKEVVSEIEAQHGGKSMAIQADVSDEAEVNCMFEQIVEQHKRLDILVHCAAIISVKRVIDEDVKTWDEMFAVNVRGGFLCSRAAARQMIKQKSGKILIASSGSGLSGISYLSCYSATKAALIRLAEALSREVGPYGICVNAFSPGWSPWSRMGRVCCTALGRYLNIDPEEVSKLHAQTIPLGREATPEDTANLVSFLCSEEANYITGQMILADGGVTGGWDLVPTKVEASNKR